MALSASRARTVFRACVVNAVRDSEALMGQLIGVTRTALTEEESNARTIAQRNLLGDALHALKQHEAALTKAYPSALLEIFAEGPAASRQQSGSRESTLDLGQLALMDDADVLAQVELSRAKQIAEHATEASLAELDTLVSAAQGLRNVHPEGNPLRPDNYIRALQQVVGETRVNGEVRQQWMRPMREELGKLLVGIYQKAAQHLREQGVEPVGYAVTGMAGLGPRSQQGGGYGHSSQMGMGYSGGSMYGSPSGQAGAYGTGWGGAASAAVPLAPEAEEAILTVGILRQMLAGGDPYQGDAGYQGTVAVPAASGYVPPEAAEAMQDIAELERLVGRLAGGQPAPVQGWSPSGPGAMPGRHPRYEVLSRMMDHIAQDQRLLPAVQRVVQNLEPALKQLVRSDSGFFTDELHPARRLLDELTRRSLAFESEDERSFVRFIKLANDAVEHLNQMEIGDAKPFARVFKALEKAWIEQDRKQRQREQDLEREQQLQEQRMLLTQQIADNFRVLPDAGKVDPALMAFVTNTWAGVVAQAQIKQQDQEHTEDDPGGFLAAVPVLLSCAQVEQLRAEPRRLMQELDVLQPVLEQGLLSVQYPQEQIDQWLAYVAGLRQQAQEFAQTQAEEPVASETPAATQPEPDGSAFDSLSDAGAWVDSTEAELGPAGQAPLHIGQWVEIINNQRAVRTQLTWCSPHNTLFLFTGIDGSTQSMTRRMMAKMMSEGSFKILQGQPEAPKPSRHGHAAGSRMGRLR